MGNPTGGRACALFSLDSLPAYQSIRTLLPVDPGIGPDLWTLQEGRISGLPSVHCGQHHVTLSADLRQSALLQSTRHLNPNPPGRWRQPCARLGAAPRPGRPRQSRRPTPRGPPPSPQGRRQQESRHRLQRESREGRRSCPAAALKLFVEPRGAHSASHGVLGGTRAPRARAPGAARARARAAAGAVHQESMARTAGRADRGPRRWAARNRLGRIRPGRNPGQDRPRGDRGCSSLQPDSCQVCLARCSQVFLHLPGMPSTSFSFHVNLAMPTRNHVQQSP